MGDGAGGRGDVRSPHLGAKKNKDEFDNACDIGDFRAHIFCPQKTPTVGISPWLIATQLNS